MRKLTTAILLLAFCLLLLIMHISVQPVYACDCVLWEQPLSASDITDVEVIFSGIALNSTDPDNAENITFQVFEVWKGSVGERITLANQPSSCGVEIAKGDELVVFAYAPYSDTAEPVIDVCSRTTSLDDAHDLLQFLGEGHPPSIPQATSISTVVEGTVAHQRQFIWIYPALVVASMVALLGLCVLLYLRKRT